MTAKIVPFNPRKASGLAPAEQLARIADVVTGEIESLSADRRDSVRVARLFMRQAALYAAWLQPIETAQALRALADELEARS